MTNDYYQKHKERLPKEAREKFQNHSGEDKQKIYQNFTEEET